MRRVDVVGFIDQPKLSASGNLFRGRFTCQAVQWTGEAKDAFVTFTITAEELASAAESRLLWTDQDIQRGIQPGTKERPARELALSDGYPDSKLYVFDGDNADDMVEKLLRGDKLFLNPLVWNLRPGAFEACFLDDTSEILIYTGRIYLPDSHHRQQAIIKAVRLFQESPSSYPKFSPSKQFKVELYFLCKDDEGNYFFDKNQRPKPTAKSKAYDLTTNDDLSILAKTTIQKSVHLRDNVNRVTDRLTAKNYQVVTLSTLREMMKLIAGSDSLDETELIGMANISASFYDLLAEERTELKVRPLSERVAIRKDSIADAAVMMHGYSHLMRDFNDSIAKNGQKLAVPEWKSKLSRLSLPYSLDGWQGDLFSKDNPLWKRIGVIKPSRDGRKITIINSGGARSECGRVLSDLLKCVAIPTDLSFLVP